MQKLTKITLGKLSASEMREIFGGESDSNSGKYTSIKSCCDTKACTKGSLCRPDYWGY